MPNLQIKLYRSYVCMYVCMYVCKKYIVQYFFVVFVCLGRNGKGVLVLFIKRVVGKAGNVSSHIQPLASG